MEDYQLFSQDCQSSAYSYDSFILDKVLLQVALLQYLIILIITSVQKLLVQSMVNSTEKSQLSINTFSPNRNFTLLFLAIYFTILLTLFGCQGGLELPTIGADVAIVSEQPVIGIPLAGPVRRNPKNN
ncbi:hypothetical protein MNBD_CHLOROFLEXI01-316 [hydrothermal vent metagenome]|uniref:Uncharacterized protein n=1 Tax=hydrothermal vent metagenome TaxID=652676 RepID=A0A3B0W3H3_9ZZZZ